MKMQIKLISIKSYFHCNNKMVFGLISYIKNNLCVFCTCLTFLCFFVFLFIAFHFFLLIFTLIQCALQCILNLLQFFSFEIFFCPLLTNYYTFNHIKASKFKTKVKLKFQKKNYLLATNGNISIGR